MRIFITIHTAFTVYLDLTRPDEIEGVVEGLFNGAAHGNQPMIA